MKIPLHSSALRALVLGTALTAVSVPAFAQDTDEIVITGHGLAPDGVVSLSERVSYSDLNLNISADKQELRNRVRRVADDLCAKLDEPATGGSPALSCTDHTYRDAMNRIGTSEALYAPRGSSRVGG